MTSIQNIIQESINIKQHVLADKDLIARIEKVADVIVLALKSGNKILFCGNGGSAADAQHLAAELSGRFYFDRPPLPAEALHCNTSFITAVANDYGYDQVYARMVKGVGNQGDVLIGLSTSGNSENILQAFEQARTNKLVTVAFTGSTGGKLSKSTDILLNIPSNDTPRIQECHIMVGHIICEIVELKLFGHLATKQ